MKRFTSESGDEYFIPDAQYTADVAAYRAAVARGDEPTMLKYETGETGWRDAAHGTGEGRCPECIQYLR